MSSLVVTAMSTSLLYHAFGLVGYDYIRQSFAAGNVIFWVQPKQKMVRCSNCRSRNILRRGMSERCLRTVPIGFRPVWLVVQTPRVECRLCGSARRIDLKIAKPKRWYTKAFERFVLTLTKAMTILDVANLLNIGWDSAKDILKRHLLVDERGVPLSIVMTGANRHDVSQLENVLNGKAVQKPSELEIAENLCADAGYSGEEARRAIGQAGYIPHIRPRGEEIAEKERNPEFKPRRWIVEVSLSWFNRFRKLLVRYEKLLSTHMALTHLAAAIIALRKAGFIYG